MTNLRISTVNPFRVDKNILPKLRYAVEDHNIGMSMASKYGIVKRQGDYYNIQYIPSDGGPKSPQWNLNTTNYTEDQMLYTVNKHGFRADNFDKTDDAIMFLGCSYVFGIGVSDEDVWCRNIADRKNKKCWNLGVPGGGNQQIYLVLDSFLESGYKPSEVVISWVEPHRKIIFNTTAHNKQAESVLDIQSLESMAKEIETEVIEFCPTWPNNNYKDNLMPRAWTNMYEEHQWFDFYNTRCQVLNLLKLHNIPYTEMHAWCAPANFCHNMDRLDDTLLVKSTSYSRPYNLIYHENKDLGRDGLHWGPNCHKVTAEFYFALNESMHGRI